MSEDRAGADAIEIARLAALPPIECDRELPEAAARLGCRVPTLRRHVEIARGDTGDTSAGQGRALDLSAPEPWPELVDGAELLTALAAAIRRHVVLGTSEATATALWVVAAYAFDAFTIFPRLLVTAPEKRCGKTTLLDVLSRLVPKPLGTSNITAAALFRVIEAVRPTLLLDEADTYARGNEELRGVLNAGHRHDGAVIRTVGDDHEPRQFSAWAPVALAAIGGLPGTVEDRSVIIGLRRRRPDEAVAPLRLDRTGELDELARKVVRWSADHAGELGQADPAMPAVIINRAADNWRPLIAVADLAGGEWTQRARDAAAELSGGDDLESIRVTLLADIRAAFTTKSADRMSSEEMAAQLGTLDDRPWPEYRAGRPITKAQIARLLKPLHISPGTIRLADGRTAKGYYLSAFADAFVRYLLQQNVTTSQIEDVRGAPSDFKTSQGNWCDVSELREIPSVSAAGDGVTPSEAQFDDDAFEERAAIFEFDGCYSRHEAEQLARAKIAVTQRHR
jgi:Protein of unknown function (DUF3631)